MKPTHIRRILRLVSLGGALLGLAWIYGRFDLVALPSEGCTPLFDLEPGDRVLVDRRPPNLATGHSVLFSDDRDRLLLGRISGAVAVAAGELWILTEDPLCPGDDSRQLGPVPVDRVRGRILFPLP